MKLPVLGRPCGYLLFSHPKSPVLCLSHQNPLAKNSAFQPNKPQGRMHATSAVSLAPSTVPSGRSAHAPARPSSSLYARPSLQQMKAERAANRARVYDFLRSLGIVPDELDGLELPVTVDVMRERVDFLHSLGLSVDDINNYPLVLGCSVKKNMVPVLDYLGKLGVRKATFTEFLRRYPQVLHSSVVVDLVPVVKYLQGMEIRGNDIPRVLEKYPEVLGFKLEGTMSTSVAYLVGIGVARREIGSILTRYPEILGMRVGRVIKPFVEYIESLGLPRLALARLIEKRPHILGFGLEDQVKPNVNALLEFGVRQEALPSVIAQYPDIMGIELKAKLASQQSLFESSILVGRDDFGSVIEKMPQAISLSRSTILKHVDFLKGRGILLKQVSIMVVGCPQLLALNLDIMKMSLDYFQSEMDRDLEELVAFPAFFTYGLESRVKPRHQIITKKGIKCSLAWLLNCSDEKFEERMKYDSIGIEEMEAEPSFDMKSLLQTRKEDDSASEYEEDSEYSEYEEDSDDEYL
ncbi:transcription termination factor MTERF4, chloroplastic [Canna indica]|uniref:Transcription termination factor MTERF4, chloroplastic n=1 Tax=Canna indica TaxID=4628 RepID=A0AAQ3Q8K1_9LILI|nr:transcription termination factor MTERF4, chloroplastic [Canna indica]